MAIAIARAATAAARRARHACCRFIGRLFREKPLGAAGGVIFVLFLLCGLFADVLAPYGMNQISPRQPPASRRPGAFPFGTDNLGRDMLSRCLYGAQLSVIIGFCAGGAGHHHLDRDRHRHRLSRRQVRPDRAALRRCLDELSRPDHPDRRGVRARARACRRSSSRSACCSASPARASSARAVVSVRENMYVHAAQSIGASTCRILWRHILPNVMPPIIVLFTTRVGTVILAESGLSFLGLGVPPPAPTWGGMLSGSGPHLHVPGTVAGAGAGPLPDRRRLRHQRVRRRACAICSIRACADRDENSNKQNTRGGEIDEAKVGRTSLQIAAASIGAGAWPSRRRRWRRPKPTRRNTAARSRSAPST